MLASRQFNEGFATTEYLAAALLDQAWYQLEPQDVPTDPEQVEAFEAAALERAGVSFAPVPPRYRTSYFNHVFGGGYSAGYYSYIWSEVLDADTVVWFAEKGGVRGAKRETFRGPVPAGRGVVRAGAAAVPDELLQPRVRRRVLGGLLLLHLVRGPGRRHRGVVRRERRAPAAERGHVPAPAAGARRVDRGHGVVPRPPRA